MNKCPYCKNKIKYVSFYHWLNKFVNPLDCNECGKTLVDSGFTIVAYILFVPMYFVTDYVVSEFIDPYKLGVVVNAVIFLSLLIVFIFVESYFLYKVWPLK